MTRRDALAIANAGRMLTAATTYLIPSTPAARIGAETWRHDAAVIREALLELLHRHARLFDEARAMLARFDDHDRRTR